MLATWTFPDSKVHGANMGPTWVLSAPDGPHVGRMNLVIRVAIRYCLPDSTATPVESGVEALTAFWIGQQTFGVHFKWTLCDNRITTSQDYFMHWFFIVIWLFYTRSFQKLIPPGAIKTKVWTAIMRDSDYTWYFLDYDWKKQNKHKSQQRLQSIHNSWDQLGLLVADK